jgi:hypothetical protein
MSPFSKRPVDWYGEDVKAAELEGADVRHRQRMEAEESSLLQAPTFQIRYSSCPCAIVFIGLWSRDAIGLHFMAHGQPSLVDN